LEHTLAGGTVGVTLIEDDRRIREGLRTLIEGTPGFRCTAAFRSAEEAIARKWSEVPAVALVDIGLPGMSGIDVLPRLREQYPKTAFIMLTVYEDDDRIFDALCAGACGYLLKNTPPARLLESIHEVITGGSPMSPGIARRVVEIFHKVRPPARCGYELTPQEVKVLALLVDGHSYKTAAAELGVAFNTVAFHVQNIYEKLQVHSKSEAVSKALRERLLD
jgi:DNA-binding NarL/FixJ family response regulator